LLYELKVELQGIDPPVWRTLQVPSRISLHKLHLALQKAMGWQNYHLHLFHAGPRRYGEPNSEWGRQIQDSAHVTLAEVVSEESRTLLYEYDMGDGWEHQITLQRVLPARGQERLRCTDGARACPPEDCGGPPGYEELLKAIADPKHEDHFTMLKWAGGKFDPEAFDAEIVDAALRRFRV
jgi:Plasmid pRiA4b ORF-3-like protein.